MRLSRRQFLQLVGAGTLGIAYLSAAPARAKEARPGGPAPAGILIDIARCIGCRSCEAACKAYHGFPPGQGVDLGPQAWTFVATRRLRTSRPHMTLGEGSAHQRTVKVQCMHCLDPACASACPVGALRKSAAGPVTYDAGRCIGCRYCMVACPFQIPRFEWHRPLPRITKCNMCAERQARGRLPACVAACPVQALQFGPRAALLAEAARRMRADPGRYVPAVYGAEEAGGTSVLYIADVPFEELGFPVVVREPLSAYTWKALGKIPGVVVGLGATLTAVEALSRRRRERQEAQAAGLADRSGGPLP
jgi:formate dehydrogenase iron-sulfur subunit